MNRRVVFSMTVEFDPETISESDIQGKINESLERVADDLGSSVGFLSGAERTEFCVMNHAPDMDAVTITIGDLVIDVSHASDEEDDIYVTVARQVTAEDSLTMYSMRLGEGPDEDGDEG